MGTVVRRLAGWAIGLALVGIMGSGGSLPAQGVAAGATGAAQASGPKLVLAFFYGWYNTENGAWGRQGEMSDRPATPYTSSDPAVIRQQIQAAKNAGIDGFISSWSGRGSSTDVILPTLLSIAAEMNFKITIYFETPDIVARGADVAEQVQYVRDTYSRAPGFLQWNNKPVLFFWKIEAAPGGLGTFRDLRTRMDPQHNEMIWSVDTTESSYLDVFDTIHLFSAGMWNANTDVAAVNREFSGYVRTYNAQHAGAQRLWTAGVTPGWDERLIQPPRNPAKYFPRNNGARYADSWQGAMSSNPAWVTITSWNEWFESTQIEASASYGNQYLDWTRQWVERYKGAQPPATQAPLPPAITPTPPPAVTSPPAPPPPGCISRNGRQLCGRFRAYWESHGGLAQQGEPISEEFTEASLTDPGKSYTVQYFERAIFEYHPENTGTPSEVLLTLLGAVRYNCKYPQGAPNQKANQQGGRYFPETGRWVGGAFREYWESHGGLAQQGYPISDEFTEASDLDPGKSYTVQYFERAVFEYHPENAGSPFVVLLAQLGTYQQQRKLCGGSSNGGTVAAPVRNAQPAPAGGSTRLYQPRFFLSAAQGCTTTPQTTFAPGQAVYAQLTLDVAPAGMRVEVRWQGGANGYDQTDQQVVPVERRPACIDGFRLEPSRYGIGPGQYNVSLRLDGVDYATVPIQIRP